MTDKDEFTRAYMTEKAKKDFPAHDISMGLKDAEKNDAVFIVSRSEDWGDGKLGNSQWDDRKFHSFARPDTVCYKCGKPTVMSNGAYEVWKKNPSPERIVCFPCAESVLKS